MSMINQRYLSGDDSEHGPDDDPTGIGILIIAALGIGVFVRVVIKQVQHNIKVPYTVVLLLVGLGIGALHLANVKMRFLSDSINNWLNLDPIVLLILFLPPLLFGDSYVVEWHVFRRLSVQALLLAVPGVLINVVLTAIVAIYAFPYDWGWPEGLLFGSMFAATDPVAVVALLKELGAPETLSVLIEGESLLNDGVAFVLFVVFEDQLTGRNSYTEAEIVGEVFKSSLVGMLFGLVGGMVALYFIQYIWSDPVLETTVTIVFAWGVFILGDLYHVSGVLAVVTMGLMFAAQSISYVSAEVAAVMHEFWHVMEYVANTMVFVFSGIVVAQNVFKNAFIDTVVHEVAVSAVNGSEVTSDTGVPTNIRPINAADFGWLIFLYIALNFFRVVMFTVLAWPLSKTGYGFNWKYGAVSSWAGLRGAVGLVGALIVTGEASCAPGTQGSTTEPCLDGLTKDLVMFHMSGIVMLTLLINGTTTRKLVQKLGLDKQSYAARMVFEKAALRMHNHTHASIESLKRQPNYKGADWDLVWSHMPVLSNEVLTERTRSEHRSFHKCDAATLRRNINKINRARFESAECLGDMLVAEARHRFLNLVKSAYHHQFKAGACSSWPALQTLIEAAARAQDKDTQKLNEWRDSLAHLCYIPDWYRDCWPKFLVRHNIRSLFITRHVSRGYDIATSFIEAHVAVESEFQNIANFEVAAIVLMESRSMIREARAFLKDVESSFDEIARHVKTSIAVQRLLKDNAQFAHGMLVNAEIDEKDFSAIQMSIEKSLKQIHRRSGFLKIQTAEDIFRKAPFFEGVNQDIVDRCFRHAVKRIYLNSETLLERGDKKSSVFLIVRGKVKVLLKMHTLKEHDRGIHSRARRSPDSGAPDEHQKKSAAFEVPLDPHEPARQRSRFWSDDDSVASRLTTTSAPSVIGDAYRDDDSTSLDTGVREDVHNSLLLSFPTNARQTPSNSEPAIPDVSHLYEFGLVEGEQGGEASPRESTRVVHIVANSPFHGPGTPMSPAMPDLNLRRSVSAAEGLNRVQAIMKRGSNQVARFQTYASSGAKGRAKARAGEANDDPRVPPSPQSDGGACLSGDASPAGVGPSRSLRTINVSSYNVTKAERRKSPRGGPQQQAKRGNATKAIRFKEEHVAPINTASPALKAAQSMRVPPLDSMEGSAASSGSRAGHHPHALLRPQSLHAFAITMDTTEDVAPAPPTNIVHSLLHPFEHRPPLPGAPRKSSVASIPEASQEAEGEVSQMSSGRKHVFNLSKNARQVSGHEEGTAAEAVWATLTKGDSVGEMELISEMPVVATSVADSIVEAYEIKFDFLHSLFREQPNSQLERNLLQQAGLLAMESHYPQLLNAPYSLLKYILHHIEIVHPKAETPEIMEKGKGILLRGKLLKAADRELEEPLIPITVFDIPPRKPLTFSDGSVVLWVPRQACLLAEQSHSHNFRDKLTNFIGHHHHHHHGQYHHPHGPHVHVPRVSRFRPVRHSISSVDAAATKLVAAGKASSASMRELSPRNRNRTKSAISRGSGMTYDDSDDSDSDVRVSRNVRALDLNAIDLDDVDLLEIDRGISPVNLSGQVRNSFKDRCIGSGGEVESSILKQLRKQQDEPKDHVIQLAGHSVSAATMDEFSRDDDTDAVTLDMDALELALEEPQGKSKVNGRSNH